MNQVVTHLLGGSLFALLLPLSSCSGTRGTETTDANPATRTEAVPPATNPRDVGTGDASTREASSLDRPGGTQDSQDDVMAQRRRGLVEQTLAQARRAMTNRLFEEAKRAAAGVLEMDPTNEEARRILIDAQTYLGERAPSGGREHMDRVIQAEIEKERTRIQALELERKGDFALERNEFDDAIESYRRARYMIVYNRFFPPGSEEEKRLDAKLARAQETRERVAREREEEVAAKSRQRLEEEERQLRTRKRARIRRLYEEANLAFQRERYSDSINLLETALQDDANYKNARDLLDLAQRARHDQNLDELKRRWKSAWQDTFDDINAGDLVQTDAIKYDMARWTEVAQRTPIEFTSLEDTETPEDREVLRVLEEKTFPHVFSDAALDEWTKWYQQTTGVNFLVSAKAKELDPESTKLRDFNLPRTNVRTALDSITRVTKLQWRVNNGVVNIVAQDERGGRSYLNYYEVRSLISPVPNYPGRDITLRGIGEDEPAETEAEPVPTVLTGDQLVSLIKDNISKETWEGGDNSISEQAGTLVVRQTRDVHASIKRLLEDLRDSTGVQVNIESRFLRVEDNFLEDLGVDFRGLGNQASEGLPGRGLEKQRPRPGVGFDDFGRRENISASAPGEIGTGSEPGFFFDDGNDGDIIGRTENLYDRTLGRGVEGLTNAGGLSLQYAFLDDTEIEIVLRAVSKQERVEEVTAPHLQLYNAQRGNLSVTNQFSYIKDFEVEIAQAAAVADPVVGVVKDGVVLDVRPVVSADRKFITIELRPTLATLTLPIPTFTTTLGVGQPISIQLPTLTVQKVRTTVTIPDGGTLMLGGMKSSEKQNLNSGVPFLRDIPVVSFLFSRKGTFISNRKVLILLRASILIPEEHEPKLPTRDEIPLTSQSR